MIAKYCLNTKRIFQIFLYLFEVIGISYGLTKLTNVYWKIDNFIDFIERMTIFYTFYQIIIYGILQQINDIKKDQYLAILTMYKYIELYNYCKMDYMEFEINRIINSQLDSKTFNDNDIRNEYLQIKRVLENDKLFDSNKIKLKIIKYEHCSEEVVLNWKYSILTRLFKSI